MAYGEWILNPSVGQIWGRTTRIRLIQQKTGEPVILTLHPIAKAILNKRKEGVRVGTPTGKVFKLPTAEDAYQKENTSYRPNNISVLEQRYRTQLQISEKH